MKIKKRIFPYLLVLPGVIILAIFIAYPTIQSIINSFFKWDGSLYSEKVFVGLKNFIELLENELFLIAFKNTFLFALLIITGTVIIGFLLAIFIDKKVKGWQFYRFAFFTTIAMSQLVVGLLWYAIYGPINGLLNNFLELLNLGFLKHAWLGEPRIALVSLAFVVIWQNVGFTMIFFLSGLKSISPTIYESAKIDGANHLKYILHIAIPMLRGIIAVVTMLMLIGSFKLFDIIWIMTEGGPADRTQVLSSVIYMYLFQIRKVGVASSISVIALIIGLIFSLIYLRFARSDSE